MKYGSQVALGMGLFISLSVQAMQCRDQLSVEASRLSSEGAPSSVASSHLSTRAPKQSATAIQQLMENLIPGDSAGSEKVASALGLDRLNFNYYLELFRKFKSHVTNETVQLAPSDAQKVAYPLATQFVPRDVAKAFRYVNYSTIKKEFKGEFARSAVLLLKKLNAGTGSSLNRLSYFQKRPNLLPFSEMGAKGTDLLVKIPDPKNPHQQIEVTIAELQLLQAWRLANNKDYAGVILQDVVGPETQKRLAVLWQKPSLIDPQKTYAELFQNTRGLGRTAALFQSHVPALDEHGNLTYRRYAPAGHGLFAVEALQAVLRPNDLPKVGNRKLIAAIANGEDLNSLPDPAIVEWTIKNRIPIVLVTTDKTSIDKKTGLITLVKDQKSGDIYLKVMDTAEAEAAGQLEHFQNLNGLVSTNLTLFNYEILREKLKNISEAELLKAMAPDLVPNWKEQKDSDGVTRKYLQLEGTMGTVVFNLDRFYRMKFGEALVSIVNIQADSRTEFFSPVKSAFDYFLQFHTDRFEIDPQTYMLRHRGHELPRFSLKDPSTKDKYYSDVQNVLDSFEGNSFLGMRDLEITGQVRLRNCILVGAVHIINESPGSWDLSQVQGLSRSADGRILLKNVEIKRNNQGVSVSEISN